MITQARRRPRRGYLPLSVFPLFHVPFLQVALHNYFYLYLSSPSLHPTPTQPNPRHPSTATALSKSTRPLIHPGASHPPYRLREDIIIIACLLFPSLPLAPSIRPSSRPWWVRQSLRRWVIVVERAGGWGWGVVPLSLTARSSASIITRLPSSVLCLCTASRCMRAYVCACVHSPACVICSRHYLRAALSPDITGLFGMLKSVCIGLRQPPSGESLRRAAAAAAATFSTVTAAAAAIVVLMPSSSPLYFGILLSLKRKIEARRSLPAPRARTRGYLLSPLNCCFPL